MTAPSMFPPSLAAYFDRMKGQRFNLPLKAKPGHTQTSPPAATRYPPAAPPTRLAVLVSTFIASFTGIAALALLTYNAQWFIDRNTPAIAGSFGASAVLIYGAIDSPLSQPRNVIGGHISASFIGVSLYKLFNLLPDHRFDELHWLLCALAVSCSLLFMQLTHTVHPPASATALIAVTGGDTIYNLGYWYMISPIALGVAIMLVVALLVNNVARRYPLHWWSPKARKIIVLDQDMATTLADFVSPEDDDNVTEDGEDDLQKDKYPTHASNGSPEQAHALPKDSTHTSLSDSRTTVLELPTVGKSSQASSPKPSHHQNHHHGHAGQVAVYYGGEQNLELRNGEKLYEDQRSGHHHPHRLESGSISPQEADLELGRKEHLSPTLSAQSQHPRTSITIERRGSPLDHDASIEEYRATIERLELRIRELEKQLPSTP
ncbi:hypothetical protein BGW38_009266 [Lunasporangiospora selenospora]|uniref:HPP transmembrane region domain-containing protein n=1 Tax=Lunasporangiospora selenospora TaxID=979761 RepID=A0A9P6KFZ7_9FUNG|nr:hypothetical protein BGW38_009266 [Lunasporangiospora selenospora]